MIGKSFREGGTRPPGGSFGYIHSAARVARTILLIVLAVPVILIGALIVPFLFILPNNDDE